MGRITAQKWRQFWTFFKHSTKSSVSGKVGESFMLQPKAAGCLIKLKYEFLSRAKRHNFSSTVVTILNGRNIKNSSVCI